MNNNPEIKVHIVGDIDYFKDDMIKIINLNTKYVTDGIGNAYESWASKSPVLISAQTGMGKNYFIEKILIEEYAKKNGLFILIVSNRIANNRQLKERIVKALNLEKYWENYSSIGQANIEDFDFVKIISYQKLNVYLNDKRNIEKLKKFSIVVFDECHFFLSDSIFNSSTEFILKKSLSTFVKSLRIYMSATPDEVFPAILKGEKLLANSPSYLFNRYTNPMHLINNQFLYYNFKRNYDYINCKYFHNITEVIEEIQKSNCKWLIFVSSKSDGEDIVKKIGSASIFINAESKNSKHEDGEIYCQIIKEEKFNCKVLVTTSVLDNGINFKDKGLKNIVILTSDKTEFLQMLGRKRIEDSEEINLYLCARNIYYFNGKLRQTNNQISALSYLNQNGSCAFLNRYFYNPEIVKGLFYFDRYNNAHINKLCELKLKSQKIFYKNIIEKISSNKEAFILEQLSWVNLENTYNDALWVDYINPDEKIADFINFLDSYCDKELTGESFNNFAEEFKTHIYNTYGKRAKDNPTRTYKSPTINKVLTQYGLKYKVVIKNKMSKLSKI